MNRPSALVLAAALAVLPASAEAPGFTGLAARAKAALAQTSGTIRLAGLQRPVTVLRDPWGVPHIYAETQADLFFAQGFVAAQDRLFQMELWRRAGEGRLAEILGPQAVDGDRFARLLRYRGDLDAEYRSYAPDARSIVESFVRGVNAYVAEVAGPSAPPERLPVEFQLAGFRPEPWTPEVCLNRRAAFTMTGNGGDEMVRALVGRELGWKLTDELLPAEPFKPLGRQPHAPLDGLDPKIWALPNTAGNNPVFAPRDGSNNWVVDGTLSATGKPLLANDPHRSLSLPSLRWLVHLNGPGWNVIGAGEPALPGVAAGHNDRVGFGFTIVGTDQQDLYVEETDPKDPNRVRSHGRWVPLKVERERIGVHGGAPVEVELKFSPHGPVIYEDPARHRAWVLRWVGTEPGTAGYLASLSLDRARSWSEFRQALGRWKVPSENQVYADVDGNVGWQVAGLTPVRKGWSGLLPISGSGKHEWQGFLPASELPWSFNPAKHFIATANHNILPPGYRREIGYDWGDPSRFLRISEVLGAGGGRKFTVDDFARLQYDDVSLPARRLVRLLGAVRAGAPAALRPWADRLARWDGTIAKDSTEAAVYEAWMDELTRAVLVRRVPAQWIPWVANRALALRLLEKPTAEWFGPDPRAGRDAVLFQSLAAALESGKKLFGPDPEAWRWGTVHRTVFKHPLSALVPEADRALLDPPSVEVGGDGDTVHAGAGQGFHVAHGASFREVLDVADWDRSLATTVPGQSGQPGSPHYADQLQPWAEGKHFPLLFSRERIEAVAKERLVLEPAEKSKAEH